MVTRRSVLAGAAVCLAPMNIVLAAAADLTGTWTGILTAGSRRLRIRIEIAADGKAAFYSLDQDNKPNSGRVTYPDADRVQIKFKSMHGTYTGAAIHNDRIEGIWQQGYDMPLTLLRGEQGLVAAASPVALLDQSALESLRREAGAPGLAAAASARGARDRIWAAGTRSIGNTAAVTTGDQWHFGSLTKSMTATLVARLVEARAITWDTRVGDVLGKAIPEMHDTYRTATFRHLLSHRAGLPANIPVAQFATFILGDAQEIRTQRKRYAQLALKMKPVGPREATYEYSNNGYIVAAAMLEAALGESWEDLMQSHLFRPLGLQSAGFGPPDAGSIGELRQPIGHIADIESRLLSLFGAPAIRGSRPGLGQQTDNPRVLGPAGRVHMTLADLLVFLKAHRDGSALLPEETWRVLHTPPFGGDYAMGWIVRRDGALWHNGSNNRWYAEALFNRETGTAAAAVCNEFRPKATATVGTSLLRAERAAWNSSVPTPAIPELLLDRKTKNPP